MAYLSIVNMCLISVYLSCLSTRSGSTEIPASARIWAKAQSPSRLMETAAAVSWPVGSRAAWLHPSVISSSAAKGQLSAGASSRYSSWKKITYPHTVKVELTPWLTAAEA